MTEETFTRAKDPDDIDPNVSAEDAEAQRDGLVWGKVCRREGINSDMLVRTEHTESDYVWVIDRSQVEPGEDA